MSPWRILFDLLGWAVLFTIVWGAVMALGFAVGDYLRALWESRGEPPRLYEYTATDNRPRTAHESETNPEEDPR